MRDVVIVEAKRTPIGRFMGALQTVPAPMLGAAAIKGALTSANWDTSNLDQVLMGNVLQAGIGQAPARQAATFAGLPSNIGAVTTHKVCGSGLRTIMDATNGIKAGEWNSVVAGGMESMSRCPHLVEGSRQGFRMGDVKLVDAMVKDGLWDPYGNKHMGQYAELCVTRYGFTRESQDAFAIESYTRAQASIEQGIFDREIIPISVPQRKGEPLIVKRDEEPFTAKFDKMPSLRPAFEKGGTITAANASKLNDGAAAVVLTSLATAQAASCQPLMRIVAYASIAQAPEWFTTAPASAITKTLKTANLSVADIDYWEINEAFAAVTMAAIEELALDPNRVNTRGGAVALGHPIGASGTRILVTLLHTLLDQRKRYGCASLCIGGGEAAALIVENLTI